MAIEGMVFVLMIASYFYLHSRSVEWPPHENPPALFWGTLNLASFSVSVIPNEWYRRRARKGDSAPCSSVWSSLSLFGVANVVIRYFELRHLNCDWSLDAYGSAVWMLMGLHVTHLLTDLVDTIVLTVLFFTPLVEGKRFMDASAKMPTTGTSLSFPGFRSTSSFTGCRGGCMPEEQPYRSAFVKSGLTGNSWEVWGCWCLRRHSR